MNYFKPLNKEEIFESDETFPKDELYEAIIRIGNQAMSQSNIEKTKSWTQFDRLIEKTIENVLYFPTTKTQQEVQNDIKGFLRTILYFQFRHLMNKDPNTEHLDPPEPTTMAHVLNTLPDYSPNHIMFVNGKPVEWDNVSFGTEKDIKD